MNVLKMYFFFLEWFILRSESEIKISPWISKLYRKYTYIPINRLIVESYQYIWPLLMTPKYNSPM